MSLTDSRRMFYARRSRVYPPLRMTSKPESKCAARNLNTSEDVESSHTRTHRKTCQMLFLAIVLYLSRIETLFGAGASVLGSARDQRKQTCGVMWKAGKIRTHIYIISHVKRWQISDISWLVTSMVAWLIEGTTPGYWASRPGCQTGRTQSGRLNDKSPRRELPAD